ncbi:hypothetical protein [Cecembia sp.]|uniref:hypothetical protein n=1 Tax=Cecembia sp. TaxID=1898110 RepID=UPI0025C17B5C|nr:hypothetical protein [Cecembia sp.]
MRGPIFFLILFLGFGTLEAQEDIFGIDTKARTKNRKAQSDIGNVTRNLISNISFEFSGGGAYHNSIIDFLSETPGQYPISQFRNLDSLRELTGEDTLRFSGGSYAFPVNLGVRINVFNTLTIGGGYGREFGNISSLQADNYEWNFEQNSYVIDRFYGTVGLVLYDARKRAKYLSWRYRRYGSSNFYMQSEKNQRIRQNYPWRFILEGEFGNVIMRQSFDENLNANDRSFYSVGLRIEREFSEYSRIFVKAGAEFRNFGFQSQNLNEFQDLSQTLYIAQVGFSINLPGTKRCKVEGCGVVMRHLHDGVEYRGSSIFRMQNRKIGQWY